jgi:hypothetical protein
MLPGYYKEVYQGWLSRFTILAVEPRFLHPFAASRGITSSSGLWITGVLDLIVRDDATNLVYAVEFKTCSAYRNNVKFQTDLQFNTYNWAMFGGAFQEVAPFGGDSYDGIYVVEVKKLLREFRFMVSHIPPMDVHALLGFQDVVATTYKQMCTHLQVRTPSPPPCPGYGSCAMCQFAPVCEGRGLAHVQPEDILRDMPELYTLRESV